MVKTLKARLIQRPKFEVDIICPFHGCYDKVYALCKSIWMTTKQPYHIYLVDDCSPNMNYLAAFKDAPRMTLVRTEKHSGFGGALAEGFNAAYEKKQPSEWVVFLHSDCEIQTTTWLMDLAKSYEKLMPQKVGIVSARSNNPGISFLEGKKGVVSDDFVLQEGALPLYCALCRRELFEHIGGFVRPYPYALYEDEELAYRMAACGLKQGVSGASWVFHHGGATVDFLCQQQLAKDYEGTDYKKIMENNRMLCLRDIQMSKMMLEQKRNTKQNRRPAFRK